MYRGQLAIAEPIIRAVRNVPVSTNSLVTGRAWDRGTPRSTTGWRITNAAVCGYCRIKFTLNTPPLMENLASLRAV